MIACVNLWFVRLCMYMLMASFVSNAYSAGASTYLSAATYVLLNKPDMRDAAHYFVANNYAFYCNDATRSVCLSSLQGLSKQKVTGINATAIQKAVFDFEVEINLLKKNDN